MSKHIKLLLSLVFIIGSVTLASSALASTPTQYGYIYANDGHSPLFYAEVHQHNTPQNSDPNAERWTRSDSTGKFLFDINTPYNGIGGSDPCGPGTVCFNNNFGCMDNNQFLWGVVPGGTCGTGGSPAVQYGADNNASVQQTPPITCTVPAPICGYIYDQNGNPWGGVTVNIFNGSSNTTTTTYSNGSYGVWNAIGSGAGYAVRVSPPGGYYSYAIGENGNMGWTWMPSQGANTSLGAGSYELQQLGNNDCATNSGATGNTCRCNFKILPIPNCNSGPSCGSCSAPANTCGGSNGSQSCTYTTYSGGGPCNATGFSQPCGTNNCTSPYQCYGSSCLIPTPIPTATSTPTPIPTATNTPTPTPLPAPPPAPAIGSTSCNYPIGNQITLTAGFVGSASDGYQFTYNINGGANQGPFTVPQTGGSNPTYNVPVSPGQTVNWSVVACKNGASPHCSSPASSSGSCNICNGTPSSCGACGGAAANTCALNNGTQSCTLTTLNGSGSCVPKSTTQACSYNNCTVNYSCSPGVGQAGAVCIPPICNTSTANCGYPTANGNNQCGGAAANTCSTNNGTQQCQYTTYSGGGTCTLATFSQACTYNNCNVANTCIAGVCATPTPKPFIQTQGGDVHSNQ